MSINFKEFIERFTGGFYLEEGSTSLYYFSDQYKSLKKIKSIDLRANSGAARSIRESDGMTLKFDRDTMEVFEVVAIRRNGIVHPGVVMKIRRKGSGW